MNFDGFVPEIRLDTTVSNAILNFEYNLIRKHLAMNLINLPTNQKKIDQQKIQSYFVIG